MKIYIADNSDEVLTEADETKNNENLYLLKILMKFLTEADEIKNNERLYTVNL